MRLIKYAKDIRNPESNTKETATRNTLRFETRTVVRFLKRDFQFSFDYLRKTHKSPRRNTIESRNAQFKSVFWRFENDDALRLNESVQKIRQRILFDRVRLIGFRFFENYSPKHVLTLSKRDKKVTT